MKSNSTKNAKQTSNKSNFKIGDLVLYTPHYEGDGAWMMSGDMGIIINIRSTSDYKVVCVQWIDPDLGIADMSTDVLTKISVDKVK